MYHWLNTHRVVIGWLFGLSVVAFIATLIAIPFLVINMSPFYFLDPRPEVASWRGRHPALRTVARMAKNMMGALFVLAGIAMLVLPGQGVLTILIGLTLIDFPHKRDLELLIVRQRQILWLINRMRTKAGRQPLVLP